MKTPIELPADYVTPKALVLGWVLLFFTSAILLMVLSDIKSNPTLLIIGLLGASLSLMLIFLGSLEKKKLITRLSQSANAEK